MCSLASTSISLRPTSTIVPGTSRSGISGGDDLVKRDRCLWFEKNLKLNAYLRDKKNEERGDIEDGFIRVNSKVLLTSYQIPADQVHGLLKRLHRLLAPGLGVKSKRKHATTTDVISKEDKRDQSILYDWVTCSDFTVQVIPKFPSVLWFDLECMVCKRRGIGQTTRERHYKSKEIIEIVIGVVLDNIGIHASVAEKCDLMYVTRGNTCGMHMFLPQVIVQTEYDGQELWAAVNTRLIERGQLSATIDTGCSSMPLPLARNHSGLTRVKFERVGTERILKTRSYEVTVPTVKELACFTNFSHIVDIEKSPPPSTVASGVCPSAVGTRVSEKCCHETPSLVAGGSENVITVPAVDLEDPTPDQCTPEARKKEPVERDDTVPEKDSKNKDDIFGVSGTKSGTNVTPDEMNDDCNDKNSSVSSSSSKRLVQSDIRTICAKVQDRRKRFLSLSESGRVERKRRRTSALSIQEPIVIDDDDDEMMDLQNTRGGTTPQPPTALEAGAMAEDTVSSFLCDGYVPSIKCSDRIPTSMVSSGQGKNGSRVDCTSRRESGENTETLPTVAVDSPWRPPLPRASPVVQSDTVTTPPASTITDSFTQKSDAERLRALCVTDDSIPPGARLPNLRFGVKRQEGVARGRTNHLRNIAQAKETFVRNMRLNLDSHENQTHETDIQLIVSGFNTEMDFYASLVSQSTPLSHDSVEYDGLRIKKGCSLHAGRENCPNPMFTEHIPFVLCSEDFVSEAEWISVLVRYFDEYMNNAPFLYVMSHVLRRDENIKEKLNAASKMLIESSVNNCLARFKMDVVGFQNKTDDSNRTTIFNPPKHPYDEKCTVVIGLIAVCSTAYNIITPLFTDIARICRLLLGNTQQTLELLNSSTMSSAVSGSGGDDDCLSYGIGEERDIENYFDESVSRPGDVQQHTAVGGGTRDRTNTDVLPKSQKGTAVSAHIGNEHSIIASILRWNYPALADQSLWGLFFYYYHVHSDALTRIMNEVVHGGLMVTALLQAYFEDLSSNTPIDVRMVCSRTYNLYQVLKDGPGKKDRSLMPPPKGRGAKKRKPCNSDRTIDSRTTDTSEAGEEKRQQFEQRPENSKKAQRRFQEKKNGRRECDNDDDGGDSRRNGGSEDTALSDGYWVSFDDVLILLVQRYLRPVSFDETTVVYTESGYEQSQNEAVSYFSGEKDLKRTVAEVFTRSVLKYSMPHGDLLMYNTDVMGTVHRRSSCTNNLVLNIFENTYGGCMSYLTRRYSNHLKIYNRFNADAYRLVVECRHAMNELVRSIELSYLNLILRQPIVPPVLESDMTVRQMFMSEEQIRRGAFVCLNVMDYVRSINMFTRHSKFSQENCKITESFLDKLIVDKDVLYGGIDEDARMRFRTVYLFFQLYIFEVLYKIRHAYNRDGSYRVSVERLSWEMDVRLLLKLFFGPREFKTPKGLSTEALNQLHLPTDLYNERADEGCGNEDEDFTGQEGGGKRSTGTRCINTRPVVSTELPDKMARMTELFGRKGIVVMKSYAPITVGDADPSTGERLGRDERRSAAGTCVFGEREESTCSSQSDTGVDTYEEQDGAFLGMTQAQLEETLYSTDKWYDNCRIRVKAVRKESKRATRAEKHLNDLETCMDATSMDTFLRTQLRINIDNGRLRHIERYVREKYDFAFCTHLPLRVKMIALVLATHAAKRLTADVATDFIRKEYRLERMGVVRFATRGRDSSNECPGEPEDEEEQRPDKEWVKNWSRLLSRRKSLLVYCRSLADSHFPESYFIGLRPENAYDALYNYMLGKTKYVTLQAVRHQSWAKDICVALNYLLVMNAYDPELVELSLRLFLGFEWPGQWAKRIFVWKSNSNAGKSFFFEHIIRKAFDQSTCINDPKGGKDNAPEKSEYYKNFVLMINEFSSASAGELKKLCSTSSYKFRMNFGNQMIQAFMVGKMVFNCNTLPLTTDHATIQRVALVPLPFWFQKRQTVVDSMLNWTRGQPPSNDYERNFRRNISDMLVASERHFFMENRNTKNEDDLFNRPNDVSMLLANDCSEQNTRASMFLVQNKTSQVYMMSDPPTGSIVSGIVSVTRYFCRFRFFNNIKEPVDYSVLPTACNNAAQEWQRISQPYFEWKERYQVRRDPNVRTKVSTIYASINHFAKTRAKNVSFFDLKQFFEWDFAEQKIPYYNAREDEYYVKIDPIQD